MREDAPGPWWRRLGWLVLIWLASVTVLALVGLAIRIVLAP